MGRADQDAVEAVKSRLDLVDLVRRYVDLKPAGERWMGACPFHQETKPSFSVNAQLGFYYCFGCQASGDVIDFYCRINGLEFREALEELARETGVALGGSSPRDDQARRARTSCLQMHELAQSFFQKSLNGPQGAAPREYVQRRGLGRGMVERFGIGWSPDEWHGLEQHLRANGFSPEQGAEAGLLSRNSTGRIYDRFRARIIFPIHDLSGRVIAFGGRLLGEGDPKYLNSSDSPIYKKGEHLYGLYQARRAITSSRQALLTEGYTDVISLVRHGFENACGVLGTSLTPSQVSRLAGFCRTVVLVFDGDRAGQEAARRSAEMILARGIACRVVVLPDGEDVDSLLQKKGAEAFSSLLEEAREGLAFCLEVISRTYSPKEVLTWAEEFFDSLQDASWKAYYLPRLVTEVKTMAVGLKLSEEQLREALSKRNRVRRGTGNTRQALRCGSAARDRDLLRFVICHPEHIHHLDGQKMGEVLGTARARAFWNKLVRYGVGENLLTALDEGEKRFYVQCRMQGPDKEHADAVLEEYRELFERCRQQDRRRSLLEDLKQAQARGDEAEVARILQAYTDVMGEPHEQH